MNRAEDFLDKKRAVTQIQRWLRALYSFGFPLPQVVPDGIYDDLTREAVSVFQGLSGLATTGTVDYVTWLALRDDYNKVIASTAVSLPIYPFEYLLDDQQIRGGDESVIVYIVQSMLAELLLVYSDLQGQEINGVFDNATVENVKRLQQVWQLPQTGAIDKETWNRLATAYNQNVNKE